MNVRALCDRMNEFAFGLVGEGIALDANITIVEAISARNSRVTWRTPSDRMSLIYDAPSTISEYISILTDRNYSFLLMDGGFVQASYTIDGDRISRHRLTYFCCPYDLTSYAGMIVELGILEALDDIQREDHITNVQLRSSMRFDYDPSAAKEYHPASHLTFSGSRGRVPLDTPLSFSAFIKFIFETFYEEHWRTKRIFRNWTAESFAGCLSQHDSGRTYITVVS